MTKRNNIRTSLTFHDYYSRLKMIALSCFEWENLPSSCSARFLEDTLFHFGSAVFVEDENMSFLTLRCVPASTLNVYNEPVIFKAFSTGYDKDYPISDCVYIRNNYLEKSTDSTILLFAERLTRIQMALDVNINAQKTPLLLRCEEKVRTSLEALYKQYDGDKFAIFGSKSLSDKPIESIKTDAPFVADKLREEKRAVWNEALEFLGLNTNPSDKKKERLIVNEVDANNEQIDIQCDTMLLCRQEACERINKLYGLNVSVKRRVDKEENATKQEVNENG